MPQRRRQIQSGLPADDAAQLARALSAPLNGLLAIAELLQRQSLTDAARVQVQTLLDTGRRMTTMLCDAIETETASTSPSPTPTALRELVDEVEDRWRSQTREGAAPFLISCNASADLRMMIDPARLRRLLNTLMDDAFKASAWGVVEVQLTVETAPNGRIAVKGSLDAPGASLMACDPIAFRLCQTIVQQLGGDLARTQSSGCGVRTTFAFEADQAGLDLTANAEAEAVGPLPPRTHLLIVDDNATNRIVAAALCEMFGCTSETAEDGLEAVDAVKSRHFDLILMDIKMPRMDGILATKTIRSLDGPGAAVPIVALTANADAAATASYLAVGMQGVVDKPIKPAQLLSMLQSVLWATDEAMAAQSSAA